MKVSTGFVALLTAATSVAAIPFLSAPEHEVGMMAPVPVTRLTCDGDTYKCTGNLRWGDGRWVAQWSTSVFHTGLFGESDGEKVDAMAPVDVTALACDGDTYKCTANLRFGDGRWVAQWPTSVFHTGTGARLSKEEMNAMAPVPVTALNCDGDSYKCTANLRFGDNRWVAQWSTAVFHTSNANFLSQN
ncbi:hypothetical protein D9619_010633 [Psilocybe cf. subviscida]|uniref:Ig-like domain-containing protein n=1 Tax=Psilocybe cf. subviscida TaxID=2480587 RepID=A0A8H5B8W5_9AGAR|nr:hypothetical protein D9619_010633 [Psilocybe cf. subviscida]